MKNLEWSMKMLSLKDIGFPILRRQYAVPVGSSPAMDGSAFLAQAMQDTLAEIEACELALQKTGSDDIKALSEMMIEQHSQMGREIEQLAEKKKVSLPKDVLSEQKSSIEALSTLSGADFDKQFLEHNAKAHEKDIEMFASQAKQGTDPDIKAFAEKGAHMLNDHLNMARKVGTQLGH